MHGRSEKIDRDVTPIVSAIIKDVQLRGDEALREYTQKFDGVLLQSFEIEKSAIENAYNTVSPKIISSLKRASENIRIFHERQKRESFIVTKQDGSVMGQRIRGLK